MYNGLFRGLPRLIGGAASLGYPSKKSEDSSQKKPSEKPTKPAKENTSFFALAGSVPLHLPPQKKVEVSLRSFVL